MANPLTLVHDGPLDIATGASREEKNWKNKAWLWSELVNRVRYTHRTAETYAAYLKAKARRQAEIKDIGGFVGGYLTGGKRKNGSVAHRQLITLDIDHGKPGAWEDFLLMHGCAAAVYTTHKHSAENPRLRLLIPLDREIFADEYEPICRQIAADIDINAFSDVSTYRPTQLMYWPSTSLDGQFFFDYQDGPWLVADDILARYRDWHDTSEWPMSESEQEIIQTGIRKQEDPTEKPGIIGAFCRTYTVTDVLETFLDQAYEPTDHEARWTYREGSTAGGLVLYEDKYAYSHHGTDPCSGKLCNAFDLVRIHKFGSRDEHSRPETAPGKLPSFAAMQDFCTEQKPVRATLARERIEAMKADFSDPADSRDPVDIFNEAGQDPLDGLDDLEDHLHGAILTVGTDGHLMGTDYQPDESDVEWMAEMETDRKGATFLTSVKNIQLILQHDKRLAGRVGYDLFTNRTVVMQPMPWDRGERRRRRFWDDEDWNCLRCLLGTKPYDLTRTPKLEDTFSLLRLQHAFHPVRDYIRGLVWDQVPRLDRLLVDYLGAEDTPYTREVSRKTLVAAVARVFLPGTKVDNVLTLVGPEGTGKSTLVGKLGGQWYSSTFNFNMLKDKTAYEQLQGHWIIEIGEMSGSRKAEQEAVKAFISSEKDDYRPAFGRETVSRPRQCIFIGTTNNEDFLQAANGNRRFWPVMIGVQPTTYSVWGHMGPDVVGQLWAEAYMRFRAGETLHLSGAVAEQAKFKQQQHEENDIREGMVLDYINRLLPPNWYELNIYQRREFMNSEDADILATATETRMKVCAAEVWCEVLGGTIKDMTTQNTKWITNTLRKMEGFEPTKSAMRFSSYGLQRGFLRVNTKCKHNDKHKER